MAEKTEGTGGERTREEQVLRRWRDKEEVLESYKEEMSLHVEAKGTHNGCGGEVVDERRGLGRFRLQE